MPLRSVLVFFYKENTNVGKFKSMLSQMAFPPVFLSSPPPSKNKKFRSHLL